ncbi:MAG: hypothetical protein ACKV2O_21045 [Acidimicrobiales bacterium]
MSPPEQTSISAPAAAQPVSSAPPSPPAAPNPPEVVNPAAPVEGGPIRSTGWRKRIMVLVALVALTIIHSSAVWPGRMSPDTIAQIEALRTGRYTDWHAPLLIMLWRPLWLLGLGPGWVTAASTLTVLVGLYGVLRGMLRRRGALIGTVATVVFPPVLGYLGYLGRDLWYVAFYLLALAGMARLCSIRQPMWRRALLGAVIGSLWLVCAARQNAAPAAGVLLVALLGVCGPWPALGRFDRTTGASGRSMAGRVVRVGVASVVLVGLVGSQLFIRRAADVQTTHPEQVLFLYDVAGVSLHLQQNQFSAAVHPAQDLASIERNWNPRWVNSLLFNKDPTFPFPLSQEAAQAVREDWLRTVGRYPGAYLQVRWALWERQLAFHSPAWWVYQPGITTNPWGYTTANPTLDEPLQRYLQAGVVDGVNGGGFLYTPWFYVLITMVGLAYLRHKHSGRALLGWACLASLVYQATVFFGAMGTDYRMVYPSVVVAVVVLVVAAVDLKAKITGRTARPAPVGLRGTAG